MSPRSRHREDGNLEAAMCPEVGYPSLASMAVRGIYIMKRLCYVTADSDPSGEWMEVEATSVFHAAIYYCGACAGRSGGPPVPTPATIITVRVDGREYRVREGQVRKWANAKAEQDAERRKAPEKKLRRA